MRFRSYIDERHVCNGYWMDGGVYILNINRETGNYRISDPDEATSAFMCAVILHALCL